MYKKQSKYKNKNAMLNGIAFDSQMEAKFYAGLLLLQKSKIIDAIELQKEYVLQDGFKFQGKSYRSIVYRCDFVVTRHDEVDIIDVKGAITKEFAIKEKLFINKYKKLIQKYKDINEYILFIKAQNEY